MEFKIGDVVAYRANTFISETIRTLTDSNYSHTALIISDTMLCEADGITGYVRTKSINNYKDKVITKLENEISYLNPFIEEFMCFDIHPISENYMYKPINSYNGSLSMARTDTYNTWIKNFPRHKALSKEIIDIEWDKPVKVFIKVDCLERFDTTNFVKAINDMVINRIYDEDDKIAVDTQIQRNKIVDSYSDGKIYFCIRNVD